MAQGPGPVDQGPRAPGPWALAPWGLPWGSRAQPFRRETLAENYYFSESTSPVARPVGWALLLALLVGPQEPLPEIAILEEKKPCC